MNPEIQKEVVACVKMLKQRGLVIFPSETGWNLGSDAGDEESTALLMNQYAGHYPAILLADSGRLQKYMVQIPESLYDLIDFTNKPLQVKFENAINIPSPALEKIKTFSIPKNEFALSMLRGFGKPVFSVALEEDHHPGKADTFAGKPCYAVNLRIPSSAGTGDLVIISYAADGSFKLIRK